MSFESANQIVGQFLFVTGIGSPWRILVLSPFLYLIVYVGFQNTSDVYLVFFANAILGMFLMFDICL
jgi:hypothetical protein